ncbi:MAG: 4-hydroxy-tetrahydrodipicolinate reductase, partial [Sphaerochaetaceae bacterium]|nr:4-hydroxy-tetrahydrodipicolinate reductase [Sphaerochaetaceae bacterium]
MIDVILYGCNGRMGTVLSGLIADIDNMRVVAGIDIHESVKDYPVFDSLQACTVSADVMIDFSSPLSLAEYVPIAMERRLPVVAATTGLKPHDVRLLEKASKIIPVFRSANMSIGINLIQQLLQTSAKILGDRFDIEIIEKHHHFKKDSPSGTALMLADSINDVLIEKKKYVNGRDGNDLKRTPEEIGIHAVRGGSIVGEHEVLFAGKDEVISISHSAYSRTVFATGAIAAALFLTSCKPKMYNMQDMITATSAVTTISSFDEEVLVTLENLPNNMLDLTQIYRMLAENDVFIDMISQTPFNHKSLSISFTVKEKDQEKTHRLLAESQKAIPFQFSIDDTVSKVSVEGPGMEFQSGVAYKVFNLMTENNISILT